MTPDKSKKTAGTTDSMKCAHPPCKCMVPAHRPWGDYCSEHCKEAGAITELRCGCQHEECR